MFKRVLAKIQKGIHELKWQLTLTITGACLIFCLGIVAVRCIVAVRNYAQMDSSFLVAGASHEIKANTELKHNIVKKYQMQLKEEPDESEPDPETVHMSIQMDYGSIFRDMKVDFRYFPEDNLRLYYIDEQQNLIPILIHGPRGPMPDMASRRPGTAGKGPVSQSDTPKAPASQSDTPKGPVPQSVYEEKNPEGNLQKITEQALSMIPQTVEHGQVIVQDGDASMALLPYTDEKLDTQGYFFLYVTKLGWQEMLIAVIKSSAQESFLLMAAACLMSLLTGFIFSRRWTDWFNRIQTSMDSWAQGNFSEKIDLNADPFIAEWRDMAERLNELSEQLAQVVEARQSLAAVEERNRLARELHDNIKQQLFSINMNLGAVQSLAKRNDPRAMEKINLVSEMSRQALNDLDLMIVTIRPVVMKDKKLYKELSRYLETWRKSTEITLNADIEQASEITDEDVSSAVFRICQEGLSNILRHSKAKNAELVIQTDSIGITLWIRDDGIGFDTGTEKSGMGLQSMQERVEQMKGTFQIQSKPGGTVIKIYIPRKMSV